MFDRLGMCRVYRIRILKNIALLEAEIGHTVLSSS